MRVFKILHQDLHKSPNYATFWGPVDLDAHPNIVFLMLDTSPPQLSAFSVIDGVNRHLTYPSTIPEDPRDLMFISLADLTSIRKISCGD